MEASDIIIFWTMELEMRKIVRGLLLGAVLGWSVPVLAVQEGMIAPPPLRLVDDFGVNLFSSQVIQNLDTVAIGGDFGLRHGIQPYANHFNAINATHGYVDRFAGNARYKKVSDKHAYFRKDQKGILTLHVTDQGPETGLPLQYSMRVFGPAGSHEFMQNPDSTFSPVGDFRHSFKSGSVGGQAVWVWRTPEGIQTTYLQSGGEMISVVYPNGFRIDVERGGVITNTGFMLKYVLPQGDAAKSQWRLNPKYVVGINLAEQYCSHEREDSCDPDGWPAATFEWPLGTPGVFHQLYAEPRVFRVIDQHGGVTEYHYQAQDTCIIGSMASGKIDEDCARGPGGAIRYVPRLVAVKTAGSSVVDFSFSYQNDRSLVNGSASQQGVISMWSYWDLNSKEGILTRVTHRGESRGYGVSTLGTGWGFSRNSSEGSSVEFEVANPGVIQKAVVKKKDHFEFEKNGRNFVTSYTGPSGLKKHYSYDSRGNISEVKAGGITVQQALYPTTCTDANFRYCNKPTWIKDAKGAQTNYTYHAASGQVASVSGPAVPVNGTSVRPTTRYQYSQNYAYYNKNSNSIERADTPVWLLTSEFSCRTSSATSTGCGGGEKDTIRTRYYYGPQDGSPNNLLLRGKSVTAEGDAGAVSTRVTCYAYDKTGNLISETLPKGASDLESCP